MKRATCSWADTGLGLTYISIHALVKRATCAQPGPSAQEGNFNPRPREEGDVLNYYGFVNDNAISIHALVKRATNQPCNTRRSFRISIHALVKRATATAKCDYKTSHISIHALVKRATVLERQSKITGTLNFNPRPREEGDPWCITAR